MHSRCGTPLLCCTTVEICSLRGILASPSPALVTHAQSARFGGLSGGKMSRLISLATYCPYYLAFNSRGYPFHLKIVASKTQVLKFTTYQLFK
jgi:hypothetical protein